MTNPIENQKPVLNKAEGSKIENITPNPHIERVELLISTLLRIGVTVSLSIVVFGTIVTFLHHPEYRSSPQALTDLTKPSATFPHTLNAVSTGLLSFTGQSLVILGLILLIATPILRVAISIFIFLHDHDRIFVYITSLVLALLLLSFVLGKAGG